MKKTILFIGLFVLSLVFWIPQGGAVTIDFDDIDVDGGFWLGPTDYAGFQWHGTWGIINTENYLNKPSGQLPSGYLYNLESGDNVGFIGRGGGGFSSKSTFDLISIYMTAGWNDGLTVLFEGKADGLTVASLEVGLYATEQSLVKFNEYNFTNIDELSWRVLPDEFGRTGTPHWGKNFDHPYFSMENVTYTPEPSTVLLMSIGLLGLLGIRRKFKAR